MAVSNCRPQTVGIIGGGIAGLSCAKQLEKYGFKTVVYDTGARGVGGRASSRVINNEPVDHAVQLFLSQNSNFETEVRGWESQGIVEQWKNDKIGRVDKEGCFTAFSDGKVRWKGSRIHGLGSVAKHLGSHLKTKPVTDQWISPDKGLLFNGIDRKWEVLESHPRAKKRVFDTHDFVVIAHNGKCADRITKSCVRGVGQEDKSYKPIPKINKLLQCIFSDRLKPQGSTKMVLDSIYSLVVRLPKDMIDAGIEGAFFEDSNVISWIGCNSRKYEKSEDCKEDSWTILSTPSFGSKHKAPQEHLEGSETETKVTSLMLTEFSKYVQSIDLALVKSIKLQLWGAGVPLNVWRCEQGPPCVWDSDHNIGIVGDWLCSPSIEGAWLSGASLADWLGQDKHTQSTGLENGSFVPAGSKCGIGDVGESANEQQTLKAADVKATGYPEKPLANRKPRRWKK